jgi:hypothetical protein
MIFADIEVRQLPKGGSESLLHLRRGLHGGLLHKNSMPVSVHSTQLVSVAVRLLAKKEGTHHRSQFQVGGQERQKTATKKSGPISGATHKEAREGGKVREGDAYRPAKQSRKGDVEMIRRGLKSFG